MSMATTFWLWLSLVIGERLSGGRENATAEQVEISAAEHLALEHLQPVDVALDRPGTPSKGEAGDEIVVTAEARNEGVQRREVISLHLLHPLVKAVAA